MNVIVLVFVVVLAACTGELDERDRLVDGDSGYTGIHGVVGDSRTGHPIAGATVELLGTQLIETVAVTTDADGDYRFVEVPPGWYLVRFTYGVTSDFTPEVLVRPFEPVRASKWLVVPRSRQR